MRRILGILALVFFLPGVALAQGNSSIVGFGGFSMNGLDSNSASVGGAISFNLSPSIQAVGEVGHLGNVLPTTTDTLFSYAGIGVSAFYGEGGVRLVAPRGALAPYAEATAGFAHLNFSTPDIGGFGGLATDVGLGFVDRNTPIASIGGGLLARSGPVVFDAGYRYKQLFADDVLQSVLGLGQPLHAHQVRFGVGVRF